MHRYGANQGIAQHEGSESRELDSDDNDLQGKPAEQLEKGLTHQEPMEGSQAYRDREHARLLAGLSED